MTDDTRRLVAAGALGSVLTSAGIAAAHGFWLPALLELIASGWIVLLVWRKR